MCGFAEQLELFDTLEGDAHAETKAIMDKAARATCDFYIEHTPPDGIPYWDAGAPGLAHLGDWRARSAGPLNQYESMGRCSAAREAEGGFCLRGRRQKTSPSEAGRRVARTG